MQPACLYLVLSKFPLIGNKSFLTKVPFLTTNFGKLLYFNNCVKNVKYTVYYILTNKTERIILAKFTTPKISKISNIVSFSRKHKSLKNMAKKQFEKNIKTTAKILFILVIFSNFCKNKIIIRFVILTWYLYLLNTYLNIFEYLNIYICRWHIYHNQIFDKINVHKKVFHKKTRKIREFFGC